MKRILLALAAMAATTFAADTPASILADYQAKSEQALEKVNKTLETSAATIIADFVKRGETAAAETLAAQIPQKKAGEPVTAPPPQAAQLFLQYDAARTAALKPVQDSAIKRIEAMLATSEGKKLETVAELGKVRAQIEGGKMGPELPSEWTYHTVKDGTSTSWFRLLPDGVLEWHDNKSTKTGKWKPSPEGFTIDFMNEIWSAKVSGDLAVVDRPSVGTRYAKVKKAK